MHGPNQREHDQYLRRIVVATVVGVTALILGALLGPSDETIHEWLVHTGTEGQLEIIDNIDIIPDDAPTSQQAMEALGGATEGVNLAEETPTPVEESEEKQAVDAPRGETNTNRRLPPNLRDQLTEEVEDRVQVERHGASQHSGEWVLLSGNDPKYPDDVPPVLRAREIIVEAQLYINLLGIVEEVLIVRNDGTEAFANIVTEALLGWQYRILDDEGNAQDGWDQVRFRFGARG